MLKSLIKRANPGIIFKGFFSSLKNLTKIRFNFSLKKRIHNIRLKLTAAFLIFFLPIPLLGYVAYSFSKSQLYDTALNSTTRTVEQSKAYLDLIMDNTEIVSNSITTDSSIIEYLSGNNLDSDSKAALKQVCIDKIENYASSPNIAGVLLISDKNMNLSSLD
jgi:hypothetical protein